MCVNNYILYVTDNRLWGVFVFCLFVFWIQFLGMVEFWLKSATSYHNLTLSHGEIKYFRKLQTFEFVGVLALVH